MTKKSMSIVVGYDGALIPSNEARMIQGKYYEVGVSCIRMPDSKWYRTTTGKILYDHFEERWIFSYESGNTMQGIVNKEGLIGSFSKKAPWVLIGPKNKAVHCMTEELAMALGYQEAISDGLFYKPDDPNWKNLSRPALPDYAKSTTYSLEDVPEKKKKLRETYELQKPKVSRKLLKLAKLIPYSFGVEIETSNGHIPLRILDKLPLIALRDGSVSGVEYTTIPLQGAKGLHFLELICQELSKRTTINQQCSVHIHLGGVRKDKLYVLSLWKVCSLIQDDFVKYFPFTRTNQYNPERKVYCKKLPDLGIDYERILNSKDPKQFSETLTGEFDKFYKFLNNVTLGTVQSAKIQKEVKEDYSWKLNKKLVVFDTLNKIHSIQGPKWNKVMRYHYVNFLNLFFSEANTVEWRIHEASTNYDKILAWLLICCAITTYAEKTKRCLCLTSLNILDIIIEYFDNKMASVLIEYLKERRNLFYSESSGWHDYAIPEAKWLERDNKYKIILDE